MGYDLRGKTGILKTTKTGGEIQCKKDNPYINASRPGISAELWKRNTISL
jgi:hypothetical protein